MMINAVRARQVALIFAVVCLSLVAGCGSDDDASIATASEEAAADPSNAVDDEDHDDEDDHGDDEDDHGDDEDDHGDEDHDDDHDDESSGGLSAHVHGAAELFVAWSGNDMVVDLVTPTNNIFGFEYEPSTDEDLAIVSERTEALTAAGVLAFNPDAGCSPQGNPDTELVFEGSHAELTASWVFVCDSPAELSELDATVLFSEFPGIEDLDAQWASDDRQSAAELSASSTILRFE